MRRKIVAHERPLRAGVGAPVHATVGRHQDHLIHHRHRVSRERLIREWDAESPPASSVIVGAEHLSGRDRPETVRVGWIERHGIDLALGEPTVAALPATARIAARPKATAGHDPDVLRAIAIHHDGARAPIRQSTADAYPGLAPVVSTMQTC